MILSFLLGVAVGRYLQRKVIAVLIGAAIGIGVGLLSGFGIAPLLYPLMITRLPWLGFPEYHRYGITVVLPDWVILQEVIYFLSYPYILISVLTALSTIFMMFGVFVGRRSTMQPSTPWVQNQ
jgi:hypothetical protein